MSHAAQITVPAAITAFVLAGNSRFTLVNPLTGNRFTFRVRKGEGEAAPYFVSVLTGSDNEGDYSYLGCLFDDAAKFVVTGKSRISRDAPSAKAFAWFWGRQYQGRELGPVQFWHEGRCGKCGRALTVPESIETGLGPVCAEKVAA